jgi:hypothetical protein
VVEQKPVTAEELRRRVDYCLKMRGQRLHRALGGELHIVSFLHGEVVHQNVDYEALVRELGVLGPWWDQARWERS